MILAVIFDLDGTLIDSRLDLIHSVNAMLRHFERAELPGELIASYVGDGAPTLVRRALASLAPPYRTVVVLREIEGLSYEEIAQVLGVAEGTVKSRLVRGRDLLRRKLGGYGAPSGII